MKYKKCTVMTEQPFRQEVGKGIKFNDSKGLKVIGDYFKYSDPSLLAKEEMQAGQGQ